MTAWSAMMKQDFCTYKQMHPRVGLGAELLQIRDGMNCPLYEAPHNSILMKQNKVEPSLVTS